jgi:hypothetical protein
MGMNFERLLWQKKAAVLERWFDSVLATYAPETANLLRKEANRFANPVGHTVHHAMEGLYDGLVQHGDLDPEKLSPLVDKIVRIRAIQDFSPSRAIAFIFLLKKIVKAELENEIRDNPIFVEDLAVLESKIDELGLLGFDIYAACREKLYEVRLNEIRDRSYRLLQRANLLAEIPEFNKGKGSKTRNT